jgi:hypothetical protein
MKLALYQTIPLLNWMRKVIKIVVAELILDVGETRVLLTDGQFCSR